MLYISIDTNHTYIHPMETMIHNNKVDTCDALQDSRQRTLQFFFQFSMNSSPSHSPASPREVITILNFLLKLSL